MIPAIESPLLLIWASAHHVCAKIRAANTQQSRREHGIEILE